MSENATNKDRLKDITDSIETGIKELFQSDTYRQYLQTMSRFHRYSVNNTMLIYLQKPSATLVAGFNKWRDQFERTVKKGEHGIKIIAPTPFKKKFEQEKLDPDTKLPILDADGKAITEEKEIKIPMYKPVTVFDVSQTEGKPLPTLAADLAGNVQNYDVFMEALRRSSPVPMAFENIRDGSDGYFHLEEERIAIREGMSEVQTISALIHEITHAKLHNKEQVHLDSLQSDAAVDMPKQKDRRTEEVEAESVSFAVCAYYGIATGENSFGYIASWSKGKDLAELRSSLETINKTTSELIIDIDCHFMEIGKERGIDLAAVPEINEIGEDLNGTWRYYIIPDLKTWAMNSKEQTPIEYFDTFNEAKERFQDLRIQAYNDEKEDLNPIGEPYAHLTLGVDRKDGASAADILHVRAGQNYIVDDFTRMEMLRSNPVVMGMLSQIADEIGFDRFKGYERAKDGSYIRTSDIPFKQWDNPYFKVQEPLHPMEPMSADETCIHVKERPTTQLPSESELPDSSMSIESMNEYGYIDDDMLPLAKERAMELFDCDLPVYMLSADNSAKMVFDMEDIQQHAGIFGITREEWESLKDSIPGIDTNDAQKNREYTFFSNPADSYAIYQLRNGDELWNYRFEAMDRLVKAGLRVERKNYELIYTGDLHYSGDIYDKLNGLYGTFNMNHPADFTGHSLSVSDIVVLKQSGVISCHYVDSFGFKELQVFLQQENYLKNAETAVEDDYGIIDGIINNGQKSSTSELEQHAKTGQPISLLELTQAAHRECNDKKKSVVEQLKSQMLKHEYKKTLPDRGTGMER